MNRYNGMKKAQEIEIASYLTGNSDVKLKIKQIRADLNKSHPFIHRMAIALYHVDRDMIQTYVYDEDIDTDIHNYQAVLSECHSLNKLAELQVERVINDISILNGSQHYHSKLIRQAGYRASVTIPLLIKGQLLGFLFVNSREKNVFDDELVQRLRLISMILSLLLQQNLEKLKVLKSTVESMKVVSFGRDPETAEHQQRMALYSLLIARGVASTYRLTDHIINYIYLYAPLHDIGKMMIGDDILFKKGKLTKEEFAIMQMHANKGDELAKKLINIYQLVDTPYISMLREIIRWHHEKMDGSGYPDGLSGEEIPVAVRIVAVADIFDALTTERPYKKAWSNEEAFIELQRLAGEKLDALCVNALIKNQSRILDIQSEFKDKYINAPRKNYS